MCKSVFSCFMLLASCLIFYACGNGLNFDTTIAIGTEPYIHRVDPANGKAGDAVTIYGYGFSSEAASNIISFGSSSVTALGYSLAANPLEGEVEALTATIPAGVSAGDVTIYVTVFENTSNANITFTINP